MDMAAGDRIGRYRSVGSIRRYATPEFLLVVLLIGLLAYLLLPPLLVLVVGSFSDTQPGIWPNFTLDTLARAYGRSTIYPAIFNSLLFSAIVATIVLILGSFLAWVVERTNARIKGFVDLFVLTPIVMPTIVMVSGWILLIGPRSGAINIALQHYLGLSGPVFDIYTFSGMIWIGVLQELPLAFLWMWPAFKALNMDYEEAALVSGASMGMVLRKVTIPILRPALVSAWIIFFIYTLGALSVPIMLGLPAGVFFYTTEIYLASTKIPTDLNVASAYSLFFLLSCFFVIYAYRRATEEAQRFVTVKGKGYRARKIDLGPWQVPMIVLAILLLLFSAVLPFAILAWNSLMPFPQAPSMESLKHITWANYGRAFSYGPARRAIVNSLLLGLAAGVISTVIGLLVAWVVTRSRSAERVKSLVDQMATASIAIPAVILGVGLTWFYLVVPGNIYGSIWILLIAYVTIHLPYAVRICVSSLSQLDRELEEAANIFGAGLWGTLRKVTIPLLIPSIFTSIIYVSLRSFREYAASLFLVAPGSEVYSVLVLNLWENGNVNVLSAYVTTVTIALAILIVIAGPFLKSREAAI